MANINGTNANDLLIGTTLDDVMRAFNGNDTIYANEGSDIVEGNEGYDVIYAGPGNDEVRGGQHDDNLNGEDGDDVIYCGMGNDIANGNKGNDVIYGGPGNDLLQAGQGDDEVNGEEDNDIIHGGLGNNQLTGGSGNDLFVIKVHPGTVTTITDFEVSNVNEKIDIRLFGNIRAFSDLKITQEGNNARVGLGANQSILLINVTATNLSSRNFLGSWSARREVYLYKPGAKLDKQFTYIPQSVKADIKKYVIDGTLIAGNPKNSDPHKPWIKIDISYFSVTTIQMMQQGSSTLIDLGDGIILEIKNAVSSQIDPQRNFIYSVTASQSSWQNELTAEWSSTDNVTVTPTRIMDDQIVHRQGQVMYVTTPLQITLANQNIPSANTQADVFKIENNAEQLQVIETFNPNNPYQVLDVTTLGIENFDKLGLTVQGNDTLLNNR